MKKALITILTVLTALLVFVSCTNSVDDYFDPPQPTPTPTPEEKVWQVQDDKFATLQEAIDSCKAAKSSGIEITLLKDAKGPGAEISGEDEAYVINFAGHSFAFTGDYGIKVSDKAFVRLTSSSDAEITLDNETEDLVLIKTEGDGAKAEIEGSANLSVADNQYVIYAKDGADVKAGYSDESLVKLSGKIASRNDSNGTKTVVSLLNKTSAFISEIEFYGVDTDKAEVALGTNLQTDGHTGRVIIIDIANYETGNTVFTVTSTAPNTIIVDENCTNADKVTGDPGVVVIGYVIIYETNGGTTVDAKPYYKNAEPTMLPKATDEGHGTITREGYVFKGWYTDSSFPETGNGPYTSTEAANADGHTGDLTFYAKWNPAVTLEKNGGTVNSGDVTEYVEGTATALPTDVTRAGYEFKGWFDNELCLGDAIASISADARGPNTYYAKWNQTAKYVGKVVAQSSTAYITPVFYSQPVTVEGYDVSYNFFYSNDGGTTFVKLGDTVAASAIVAGNGNTESSTAKAINTALQASISSSEDGHATSDSTIYYEVVDANGKYDENKDAYAAFYMYIPADSGVNAYTNSTDTESKSSSGSSFMASNLESVYTRIKRENNQSVIDNEPNDWPQLNFSDLSSGSIGGEDFITGRAALGAIGTWIGSVSGEERAARTNVYYQSQQIGSTGNYNVTAWNLLSKTNSSNTSTLVYRDWFIPSYGEMLALRRSFGDTAASMEFFGKALAGDSNFNKAADTNNVFATSSVATNGDGKRAVYWDCTTTERDTGHPYHASFNDYPRLVVTLVRTF